MADQRISSRCHPRMRMLRSYRPPEVEAAGVPAVVVEHESLLDGARFEAVYARDSLRLLGIHGAPKE